MSNDQNPFSTPNASDIPTGKTHLQKISYGALKTGELYVSTLNAEVFAKAQTQGKLGFSIYDSEQREKVPFADGFMFALLEVYACVEGDNGKTGNERVSFYSNKVRSTVDEPIRICLSGGQNNPIAFGLYQNLKAQNLLPKEVSYKNVAVVYCLTDGKTYELALSFTVKRGMQKALAAMAIAAGKKKANWEGMNLRHLVSGDQIFGFNFKTFVRVDKEGSTYERGDLYFEPSFDCGVIQPNGNMADAYNTAVEIQTEIRSEYDARKKKYASGGNTDEDQDDDVQAGQEPKKQQSTGWGTQGVQNDNGSNSLGDDLPF